MLIGTLIAYKHVLICAAASHLNCDGTGIRPRGDDGGEVIEDTGAGIAKGQSNRSALIPNNGMVAGSS